MALKNVKSCCLHFVLFLGIVWSAKAFDQDALNFWSEKLPGVDMPATFIQTVSPLDPSQISLFSSQLNEGTLSHNSSGFCAEAKLTCASKISHPIAAYNHYINTIAGFEGLDPEKMRNSFFRESDLVAGKTRKMVTLENPVPSRTFLPAGLAERMLFKSDSLPALLHTFNIAPGSMLAKDMKRTLEICGYPAVKGEVSTCAISVESLVEFVNENLGSNVKILGSTGGVKTREMVKVLHVATTDAGTGKPSIACHKIMFPFEVHYCHAVDKTKVLVATLQSMKDGSVFHAAGVCHLDTSEWPKSHPAFTALGVKAGDGNEVCHFSNMDDLLWVSN